MTQKKPKKNDKNKNPIELSLDPEIIPSETTSATKFNYIKLP